MGVLRGTLPAGGAALSLDWAKKFGPRWPCPSLDPGRVCFLARGRGGGVGWSRRLAGLTASVGLGDVEVHRQGGQASWPSGHGVSPGPAGGGRWRPSPACEGHGRSRRSARPPWSGCRASGSAAGPRTCSDCRWGRAAGELGRSARRDPGPAGAGHRRTRGGTRPGHQVDLGRGHLRARTSTDSRLAWFAVLRAPGPPRWSGGSAKAGLFARTVSDQAAAGRTSRRSAGRARCSAPRTVRKSSLRDRWGDLLAGLDTTPGVRLLGVGVAGLTDVLQEDLFADDTGGRPSPRPPMRRAARRADPATPPGLAARARRRARRARPRLGLGLGSGPGDGPIRDPGHPTRPGPHLFGRRPRPPPGRPRLIARNSPCRPRAVVGLSAHSLEEAAPLLVEGRRWPEYPASRSIS